MDKDIITENDIEEMMIEHIIANNTTVIADDTALIKPSTLPVIAKSIVLFF